jgi:hypothetical protein
MRTLTVLCVPTGIENVARPRVTVEPARELVGRRRAVSLVLPEQRATVPAGQRRVTVMNPRAALSLVDTNRTPANGRAEGGVVGGGVVQGGVAGGVVAGTNSSAPMSVVPIARGSPSNSSAPLIGSLRPASIVYAPGAWR